MSGAQRIDRPVSELWLAFTGPTLWLGHFLVLYAAEGFACAGFPHVVAGRIIAVIAVVSTAIAVAALIGFIAWRLRRQVPASVTPGYATVTPFLHRIALMLAGLSLLGVLWVAWPAVVLSTCG